MDTTGRGHGGRGAFDQGAVGSGTTEYKEVSAINDFFRKFNQNWADVSDFSASDVNTNLYNIVQNTNAKSNSNERTLSHHMNAFNGKATGVEVWYYAGDNIGRSIAEKLSAAISNALGLFNRGAKATTSLYVVSNTNPHCVLIEWCFVDNWNDISAWNKNKVSAMNAAMNVLGMKTGIDNGGGSTVKPKQVSYQTKQGWYEALKDDVFYCEKELKRTSKWNIKKGMIIYVEIIEKVGNCTRAKIDSGKHTRYCTLRDDFWKFLK